MINNTKSNGRIALLIIIVTVVALSLSACKVAKQPPAQEISYNTVTEICDWGAAVTKVIVNLGKTAKEGSLDKDTFKVSVSKSDARVANPLLEEGNRAVTKAYVSDKKGNPAETGEFVALEMAIGPDISLCSPINYFEDFNAWVDNNYTITQVKDIGSGQQKISGLVINKRSGDIRKLVDDFSFGKGTFDNIAFTYADYKPVKDQKKNPLIIWLHGWGEGGTDATIPISANKAVSFSSKEIQSYFGGAYVLVPQAKTYWMEGFSDVADGTSTYEKALMSFVKDYVSKNSDIDQNRIYIGGCSSGGYMTMLMVRDYSKYYAAAFPVCEGLLDTLITDEDIQKMKDVPMWFVAAKTDPTLPPDNYSSPTFERLKKAGAKNVYYTLFDDVSDTSGLYKNADGTPYKYNGHFSWIYVFNNECKETINGRPTTIIEWLASMKLSK